MTNTWVLLVRGTGPILIYHPNWDASQSKQGAPAGMDHSCEPVCPRCQEQGFSSRVKRGSVKFVLPAMK